MDGTGHVAATHLVVGLDSGGSKTLLRGEIDGRASSIECRGEGANPNRVGMDRAAEILVELIHDAIQDAPPIDRLSVCAGVSGAGRSGEQEVLADAVRQAFAGPETTVHVEVVHDALIALDAAYDLGSGLILIAGTGSVVLARGQEETLLRAGGWGHILGDPGSGYAIGQAGLRAVAEDYDGGATTDLRSRLREHCGVTDRECLIHRVYQENFKVQSVAPLVVEAAANDDAVASDILVTQASNLAEQVGWVLDGVEDLEPRITMLGGMVQNSHYADILQRILGEHFPACSVSFLEKEPVVGALRRAYRLSSAE